jgi:uncharacterized protein (DUF983 family)
MFTFMIICAIVCGTIAVLEVAMREYRWAAFSATLAASNVALAFI